MEIYQTDGNAIALGLTINAKAKSAFFETTGTIWFVANAAIDNDQKIFCLQQIRVYGNTDNAAGDIILAVARLAP